MLKHPIFIPSLHMPPLLLGWPFFSTHTSPFLQINPISFTNQPSFIHSWSPCLQHFFGLRSLIHSSWLRYKILSCSKSPPTSPRALIYTELLARARLLSTVITVKVERGHTFVPHGTQGQAHGVDTAKELQAINTPSQLCYKRKVMNTRKAGNREKPTPFGCSGQAL